MCCTFLLDLWLHLYLRLPYSFCRVKTTPVLFDKTGDNLLFKHCLSSVLSLAKQKIKVVNSCDREKNLPRTSTQSKKPRIRFTLDNICHYLDNSNAFAPPLRYILPYPCLRYFLCCAKTLDITQVIMSDPFLAEFPAHRWYLLENLFISSSGHMC